MCWRKPKPSMEDVTTVEKKDMVKVIWRHLFRIKNSPIPDRLDAQNAASILKCIVVDGGTDAEVRCDVRHTNIPQR